MAEEKKDKTEKAENSKPNIIMELAPYTTLGIQLVLTIGVCGYLGWLIDENYNTAPVFLIILTFFGAIAGMVTFIRTALKKNKKKKI